MDDFDKQMEKGKNLLERELELEQELKETPSLIELIPCFGVIKTLSRMCKGKPTIVETSYLGLFYQTANIIGSTFAFQYLSSIFSQWYQTLPPILDLLKQLKR